MADARRMERSATPKLLTPMLLCHVARVLFY